MATATRDVQVIIDGPSPLGDWSERERRRRRDFRRIVFQLFLIPAFVAWLEFTGTYRIEFGALLAGMFAVGILGWIPPVALGERPGVASVAATACFGVIVCTLMRVLNLRAITTNSPEPVLLGLVLNTPVWAAWAVCGYGYVVTRCFTGWCLAIPDRDIVTRHQYLWALTTNYRMGWRLTLAKEWAQLGAFAFTFLLLSVGSFPGRQSKLAVLIPMMLFAVGTLVGVLASGSSLFKLMRATWRALVVFHTYDVPAPGRGRVSALGIYTFPSPLRDHRLRVVLSGVVVAICSVALCMSTGWPAPAEFKGVWARFDIVVLAVWVGLAITKLACVALAFLLWAFITLTAVVGPLVTLVYEEFAEGAVKQAEGGGA